MYQAYYKKQRRKSIIIITFLVLFSLISTYLIYEKFANSRDKDYDTGKMEVVFHEKNGNEIKYNKYEKIFESIKNQLINSELFEFIGRFW